MSNWNDELIKELLHNEDTINAFNSLLNENVEEEAERYADSVQKTNSDITDDVKHLIETAYITGKMGYFK